MRKFVRTAYLVLAVAAAAAGLPPEGQPPPHLQTLRDRLLRGSPEERAAAAAALALDPREEAAATVADTLQRADPAPAHDLLAFLADRPDPRFAAPLVAASRRNGLAEAAVAALDALGRTFPDRLLDAAREGLARSDIEERAPWIAALGFARTEKALPHLVALLPGREADAAMAALRRLTTLPFTEPRDWNFWWDQHRTDSLEEILRDANRRLREEAAAARAAAEREAARANELEKGSLKERLRAIREKKDAAAERSLLEKELGNVQAALRAWALEEARQALEPAALLPAVLRAMESDPSVSVRAAAVRAAGAIGREKSVDALRARLADPAPAIRVAAVEALTAAAGAKAAPDIQKMLDPAQPRAVREAAVAALKALKPKGFAAEANRLLDAEWRKPAAESLAAGLIELVGALADESSLDVLVAVVRGSSDKTLRFRAVKALGDLRTPAAAGALIAELDRPAGEQEKDVAAEAIAALAATGGDRARERLERALGEFLEGEAANPRARENAARGLGRAGNVASVDALIRCAKGDPDAAVRKEAFASAFALSSGATNRLDALEALVQKIGGAEADATWRIMARGVIVKPGNFPEAAERVKAHHRPLADDYFAQKDWPNALVWYRAASAEPLAAARAVLCLARTGEVAAALEEGGKLLESAKPGEPAWSELRRALIEARCATREYWRASAWLPDAAAAAALSPPDLAWFNAERARLTGLARKQVEEVESGLAQWPDMNEEARREFVALLRAAPPAEAIPALLKRLEGPDASLAAAAVNLAEQVTGIAVPAEAGEARKRAIEDLRQWPAKQTP
jgi:HEAT repeat protein